MATRNDVAKKAGVSVATVSNVVNMKGIVSEKLAERVLRAVDELDYVPDYNARCLSKKQTKHIGIAIFETTNPYHLEIVRGIEDYAAEMHYIVSIFLIDNNMHEKLAAILERKLDGLVNFMTNQYPDKFINLLKKRNVVLINFDSKISSNFVNNYYNAMVDIMQKLHELGHTKVGYASSMDEANFKADSRGKAFLENRKRFNFIEDDDYIYYNTEYNELSEDAGYKATSQLLKRNKDITALFTTNDLSAMGAIRALVDHGKKVPEDVSVVGCDNIRISKYFVPTLTTIGVNKYNIGLNMAKQIIAEINGASQIQIVENGVAVFRESITAVKRNRICS